ncbi:MAG TPA: hypothetical protein VJ951_12130 [Bacteroidales bacterium]|nr:hypothetical protein [Bacteroidales bacterium]
MKIFKVFLFVVFANVLVAQKPHLAIAVQTHNSFSQIAESNRDDPPGSLTENTVEINISYYRSDKWLFKGGLGSGNRSANMKIYRSSSRGSSGFGLFQLAVGTVTRDVGLMAESVSNLAGGNSSGSSRQLIYSGNIWELTAGVERLLVGSWDGRFSLSGSATFRRTQISDINIESSAVWATRDIDRELMDPLHRVDAGLHMYLRPIKDFPVLINTSMYIFSLGNSGVSMYENKTRIGLNLGLAVQL